MMDFTRSNRTPKLIFTIILILIILGIIGLGIYRYNRPLPSLTVGEIKPAASTADTASVDLPFPNSGEGALATADGLTLGEGTKAHEVHSTASIAKLITILTVLQKRPLKAGEAGPTIIISQDDVDLYNTYYKEDGSNVQVALGEKISEYQMLEGMLLPSGNNIADSLAIWAFGSLSAYRTAAQSYVKSIGMTDTTIGADASGFAPDTTSTASDLIKLGQAASKQAVITEIAAQKTATLPVVGSVVTTNNVLGQDGITGLKTGTSDEAGNSFVFTATHNFGDNQSVAFVGVVLGALTEDSRFSVAQQLLETTYDNYKQVTIAKAGESLGTIKSAWGQSANIGPLSDVTAYTWLGSTAGTSAKTTLTNATTVAGNATVGTISIDNQSTPLVTSRAITGPSIWWRLFHS